MRYTPKPERPADRSGLDRRAFLSKSILASGAAILGGSTLLSACGDDGAAETVSTTLAPAAATGAATGAGTATTKPKVQATVRTVFSWVKNTEWAGWWVADDQGHFKAEGITSNFIGGGPNAPQNVQVISAGQADLGTASDTLKIIDAAAQGADFVMIATAFQQSPLGIAWLDPNIKSLADLNGKKIGGSTSSVVLVDAALKLAGIEKKYEFVAIGSDPAPLAQGQVDAIVCYATNQPSVLELQGLKPIHKTFTELGLPLYADAVFASRSYLDKNRDIVVQYLRGLIKGFEQNMKDTALGAKLAVEKYGVDLALDPKAAAVENAKQVKLWTSDVTAKKGLLWMDKDYITNKIYPGVLATGRSNLPAVDKLFDLSFLEEAYGGKTSLLGS